MFLAAQYYQAAVLFNKHLNEKSPDLLGIDCFKLKKVYYFLENSKIWSTRMFSGLYSCPKDQVLSSF